MQAQLRPFPQGRHLQMNFSYYGVEKQCGLWPAPSQPSLSHSEFCWLHICIQQISFVVVQYLFIYFKS